MALGRAYTVLHYILKVITCQNWMQAVYCFLISQVTKVTLYALILEKKITISAGDASLLNVSFYQEKLPSFLPARSRIDQWVLWRSRSSGTVLSRKSGFQQTVWIQVPSSGCSWKCMELAAFSSPTARESRMCSCLAARRLRLQRSLGLIPDRV